MRSIKKRTSLLTPDKGIYISRGFWVFFPNKITWDLFEFIMDNIKNYIWNKGNFFEIRSWIGLAYWRRIDVL